MRSPRTLRRRMTESRTLRTSARSSGDVRRFANSRGKSEACCCRATNDLMRGGASWTRTLAYFPAGNARVAPVSGVFLRRKRRGADFSCLYQDCRARGRFIRRSLVWSEYSGINDVLGVFPPGSTVDLGDTTPTPHLVDRRRRARFGRHGRRGGPGAFAGAYTKPGATPEVGRSLVVAEVQR